MRKKHSLLVTFRALLYLLGVKRVLGRLVDVDFAKELSSNKQLAAAGVEAQSQYRARLRESTIQRAVLLRRKLIVSTGWIIGAAAVDVLSIVSFSIATLGRLG